jgi:TolB protein
MRRTSIAPALLAAVTLQLGPPRRVTNVQDAYPMLSPDGSRVLFQSNRTGDWEIYTMRPDGTDLVRLTNSPGPDVTPIWSPDGKKIVFASERDVGDSEIYLMKADGSEVRRLTRQPGDDSHPHWSPDGSRIVFNSARATPDLAVDWSKQHIEIFTMAADGTDVRQITRFKTVSTYPSFSPDGKRIAFRRVTDEPGFLWDLTPGARNSEVFVMNVDGSNPVNVSKSAAYDGWPAWSPDGAKIVFSSNRSGPANIGQLYSVDPDGGNLQKLTDGPGSFVQPSWSRDGRRIYAFQHWETEEFGNLAVFDVVNSASSGMARRLLRPR